MHDVLEFLIRGYLAYVLATAGVAKMINPSSLANGLEQFRVPQHLRGRAAQALGGAELALAFVALFGSGRIVVMTMVPLFVTFAGVAVFLFRRGVDCGCGSRVFERGETALGVSVPRIGTAAALLPLWWSDSPQGVERTATLGALGAVFIAWLMGDSLARMRRNREAGRLVALPFPATAQPRSRRAALATIAGAGLVFGTASLALAPAASASACGEAAANCCLTGVPIFGTVCDWECVIAPAVGNCDSGLKCCTLA